MNKKYKIVEGVPILKNKKKIKFEDLCLGDKVSVGTIFGRYDMFIHEINNEGNAKALTEDGNLGAWLYIDPSDNYCWYSNICFDAKAKVIVKLI